MIDYLREEVRVLKELRGKKRLRFTDEQRRRLARKAKRIGFGRLKEIVGLVTPQTLLGWHRKLIAKKYDSSGKRRKVGRPPTKDELRDLVIKMAEENRGGATRGSGERWRIWDMRSERDDRRDPEASRDGASPGARWEGKMVGIS